MKQMKVAVLTLCAGMVMAGCNNLAKGTAIGAAGGAVLGAVVGKIAGNTAVGAAVGTAVGAGTGALIGKHMDKVKAQAEAVQNAQVESVTDANGLQAVKVTFDSGILFTTGSSTLSQTAKNSLSNFANVLKTNTDCDVAVQGYTDNAGWKNSTAEQSAQKNLNLSQQRAQAVTNYLQSLGVSPSQIRSTTGYGEANPVADNSTAAGKAQNRRVEVYMYASQAMIQAAEAGTLQ
ncbi:MAG: OmpA family protein [Prevotella sp.]|jgi:outer membrane protein OmpA-like peptidoglycan-associated protein|nr:OmpA family protein [Prevotella sp.]